MYIRNREELTSHGETEGREAVVDIIEQALLAADPYSATTNLVQLNRDILTVGDLRYDLSRRGRIYVLGAGKATFPIAKALEEILRERIADGIVIVKEGQEGTLRRIKKREASHPLPNEQGFMAAQEMKSLAEAAQEGDIVFCAITGGSSALAPLPAPGITIEEKRKVHELLLNSGATIREINAVRKHLSRIKGGRLALSIFPAEIINLTVSDVTEDPLDYITGPTVPDTSTFADAIQVLNNYDLLGKIPESAREYLLDATAEMENPKDFSDRPVHDFVIVKSSVPCEAASNRARGLGFTPMILTSTFEGESKEVSYVFTSIAREVKTHGRPLAAPCAVIASGETTVTLCGEYGKGGANQEFALSAALQLDGRNGVVIAAIDTDGTDGPTELAGGIVDSSTTERARQKGLDLRHRLRSHDATTALTELGDAIRTGHTGTNVNDLYLMLVS